MEKTLKQYEQKHPRKSINTNLKETEISEDQDKDVKKIMAGLLSASEEKKIQSVLQSNIKFNTFGIETLQCPFKMIINFPFSC